MRAIVRRQPTRASWRRACGLAGMLVAWVLAVLAPGCKPASEGPDLVLVSIDTVRADHLSMHGYERDTTPHLAKLAAEGVRFDAAYAPTATTGPSHATLFTGLHPREHGVVKNGRVLPEELTTLADVFAEAGYQRGGVVSSYVLTRRFGYAQGFDFWSEDFSQARVPSGVTIWEGREIEGKFYGSGEDTTRRALEWLEDERDPSRPFFLFVHYFDPHDPYEPPRDFPPPFPVYPLPQTRLGREILRYDMELAFVDQSIADLVEGLDRLGLAGQTLLVVTGDHGEGLGSHGHMHHGIHLYEEAVRVPLVLRWPGRLPAKATVARPVGLDRLAATLLELLADAAPAEVAKVLRGSPVAQRAGYAALARGEKTDAGEVPIHLYRRHYDGEDVETGIFDHTEWTIGERFGLRRGRYKLIVGVEDGTRELFDLEADPAEKENRVDALPEVAAALNEEIDALRAGLPPLERATSPIAPEERARLEALGYGE